MAEEAEEKASRSDVLAARSPPASAPSPSPLPLLLPSLAPRFLPAFEPSCAISDSCSIMLLRLRERDTLRMVSTMASRPPARQKQR
jgi:hypothetical protein